MEKLRLEFEKEKDTKNTTRYKEVVNNEEPTRVGTIYVQAEAVKGLGSPETLVVEVKAKP